MCGVIGYIGHRPCLELIYSGLKKLEYRGYDSAGIAVLSEGKISFAKEAGKLKELQQHLSGLSSDARVGLGHTRWATHGEPTKHNAHPHFYQGVAMIHNGIIENFAQLKEELIQKGHSFESETDTEVFLKLLVQERTESKSLQDAIFSALEKVRGAFAMGILTEEEPDYLYVIKHGSPMVLGLGNQEAFFASDAIPLAPFTNKVVYLEDGQIARLSGNTLDMWDFAGKVLEPEIGYVEWTEGGDTKAGYKHYMLKEIHEQPEKMRSIIRGAFGEDSKLQINRMGLDKIHLDGVSRVHILGCGTAFYAGLLGKYHLEKELGLPVEVELASEFRYREPQYGSETLVIAMTQSGETADTLACVKHAKQKGCQVLAICNVPFSAIPRASTATFFMECGPEIGVASTKAFSQMVLCLYLIGYGIQSRQGKLSKGELSQIQTEMQGLPDRVEEVLKNEDAILDLAREYFEASSAIFMGRGSHFPIALEGALKLKEVSYIHAEGYAGGELKHGPIALIDHHMPIFALAPDDALLEKMVSNIEEAKARKGKIVIFGPAGSSDVARIADHYVEVPQTSSTILQAVISIIPLQLFSYFVATLRGTDVDQPRNLAKSVTVE